MSEKLKGCLKEFRRGCCFGAGFIFIIFLFVCITENVNAYTITPETPDEDLILKIATNLNLSQNETILFLDMMLNNTDTHTVILNTSVINNTIIIDNTITETITINKHFNKTTIINNTIIKNHTTQVIGQQDPFLQDSITQLKSDIEFLKSRPEEKDKTTSLFEQIYMMDMISDAGYDIGPDGKPVPKGTAVAPLVTGAVIVDTMADVITKAVPDSISDESEKSYITAMMILIVVLLIIAGFLGHKLKNQKTEVADRLPQSYGNLGDTFMEETKDELHSAIQAKGGDVSKSSETVSGSDRIRTKKSNKQILSESRRREAHGRE